MLTRYEIETGTMTYSMGYNVDVPITISALALSPDNDSVNLAAYAHDLQSDPSEGGDFGFVFIVDKRDGRVLLPV